VEQADVLLGVHLPDLVGLAGPAVRRRGPAWAPARARRGLGQPAAQGPLGRQGRRRGPGQGDAEAAGAPAGVEPAQLQGQLPQGLVRGGAPAAAGGVGRGAGGRVGPEAAEQVAHGAGGQVQGARDLEGGLVHEGAQPDLLPQGLGQGTGHRDLLRAGEPFMTWPSA